ncbi:MAG: hypothetical protein KAI43_09460 [Candidatus Aureabacteria bacterium]|nr:hypothetical protein [Candidatus Auribacterota bacterium]
MAYPYRYIGNDIRKYMKFTGNMFSTYIVSILYGHFKGATKNVYDVMTIITGIFIFYICYEISLNSKAAYLTVIIYYLVCFTPRFHFDHIHPEWIAYLFITAGCSLMIYGINTNKWMLMVTGVILSSLSFWCKISVIEGFWPIVFAAYFTKNINFIILTTIILILSISISLVIGKLIKKDIDNSLYMKLNENSKSRLVCLFKYIVNELNRRFINIKGYIASQYKSISEHITIILPVIILFILYLADHNVPLSTRILLSALVLTSMSSSIIHLWFWPIFSVLMHVPIILGAILYLQNNVTKLLDSKVAFLSILILFMMITTAKLLEMKEVRLKNKRFYDLSDNIYDYLKDKVKNDDYIFQDSNHIELYLRLNVNGPPMQMIYANSLNLHFKTKESVNKLIKYFSDKRPKYYIAAHNSINLDELEYAGGIKYEIDDVRYCNIYRIKENIRNSIHETNQIKLFTKNVKRYENDKNHYKLLKHAKRNILKLRSNKKVQKVILFGFSELGEKIMTIINNNTDWNILGYIDNDKNSMYRNSAFKVYDINCLKSTEADSIIICSYSHNKCIRSQLASMRIHQMVLDIYEDKPDKSISMEKI